MKQRKSGPADLVAVILFLIGTALIAAGLWLIKPALSLVFLGVTALYLGGALSRAANSRGKDGSR